MYRVLPTSLRCAFRGGVLAVVAVALAAVAQPSLAGQQFGVFRSRTTLPDAPRLQYLGAKWTYRLVRPLEARWWSFADSTIALQCNAGLQQYTTFTAAPDTFLNAYIPSSLPAWADSVSRVVERYDGDGFMDMPNLLCPNHYWHIEAEDSFWKGTIDEYLAYLAVTRAAILSADPAAKVITMGLSSSRTWNAAYNAGFIKLYPPTQGLPYNVVQPWSFDTQRLINEGAYDILDVHSYETHNVVAGKLAWIRSLMPEPREIWAMEGGAPFLSRAQGYTDTLGAQATVQWLAECAANGVSQVADAYHPPTAGNFDYTDQFINVSLTRWNPYPMADPKPSFEAYSQVTEKLAGFTSAADMSDRTGVDERYYLYDMRFQTPRGPVDIVWAPTGTRSVSIPATGVVRITSVVTEGGKTKQDATVTYLTPTDGFVTLNVTNAPLFVEGGSTSALPRHQEVSDVRPLAIQQSRTAAGVELRCNSSGRPVEMQVLDVRGGRIRQLVVAPVGDGTSLAVWNCRDARGGPVARGVYFVTAREAGGRQATARLLFLP